MSRWLAQKLKSVKPSTLLALLMYIALCTVMYVIEYRLYPGVYRACFAYALTLPIITAVSRLVAAKRREGLDETETDGKRGAAIVWVLVAAMAVGIGYLIYRNPYELDGYLLLAVGVAYAMLAVLGELPRQNAKAKRAHEVIAVYSMMLVAAALYVFAASPCTVSAAEATLVEKGFENASYMMCVKGKTSVSILKEAMGDKLYVSSENEAMLGMYFFSAEMSGEEYGVFVDVVSGGFAGGDRLSGNDTLRYMAERKRGQ